MASAQRPPGVGRRRVVRNLAIPSQPLPPLISLGQRFRVHRRKLGRFRRTRPAGDVQHPYRRRFICLRLPGKVIAAAPRRIDRLGLLPARILLDQNIHIELSHGADIESVVAFEVFLHVDQLQRLQLLVRKVCLGLHDLARRLRRVLERARICQLLPARLQERGGKVESVAIREGQLLFQKDRCIPKRRRIRRPHQHSLLERFNYLRRFQHRLPGRRQRIVEQHHHRLPLDHRLPRRRFLVVFDVAWTWIIILIISIFRRTFHPFLNAERLVLERVRQFVRQHRLLLFDIHPVQQIHSSCFDVVVSRHLLPQHRHQEGGQVEVPRQQPEFLQHRRRPLQSLRVLVVLHALLDVGLHLVALGQPALHLVLDREARVLAGKLQDLVHRAEKFLRLFGRDDGFLCGAGALARGGLDWSGLRLILILSFTLVLGLEARIIDVLVVGWSLGLVLRPRSVNQQCE